MTAICLSWFGLTERTPSGYARFIVAHYGGELPAKATLIALRDALLREVSTWSDAQDGDADLIMDAFALDLHALAEQMRAEQAARLAALEEEKRAVMAGEKPAVVAFTPAGPVAYFIPAQQRWPRRAMRVEPVPRPNANPRGHRGRREVHSSPRKTRAGDDSDPAGDHSRSWRLAARYFLRRLEARVAAFVLRLLSGGPR